MRRWARSAAVSLAMAVYGALFGYVFAAWLGPIGSVPCAILGFLVGTALQAIFVR